MFVCLTVVQSNVLEAHLATFLKGLSIFCEIVDRISVRILNRVNVKAKCHTKEELSLPLKCKIFLIDLLSKYIFGIFN